MIFIFRAGEDGLPFLFKGNSGCWEDRGGGGSLQEDYRYVCQGSNSGNEGEGNIDYIFGGELLINYMKKSF